MNRIIATVFALLTFATMSAQQASVNSGSVPSETNVTRAEYPRVDPVTRKVYFRFDLPRVNSLSVKVGRGSYKGVKGGDGIWTIETDPVEIKIKTVDHIGIRTMILGILIVCFS